MPGSSQGVVVSIQAKIEGWQNQIKAIQDALKNIKAGSTISKDLGKELHKVESLVNGLGKNINQRLTSDAQIISFTDKMKEVDELFMSMGQHMLSISFADMDPSYITNNFKDLLSAIEQANNALSTGMTNSFQNAIANSTHLQKAFDKLGIDPTKMGIEELKSLLETKSSGLAEELSKMNEEINNLRTNAKTAEKTVDELSKKKFMSVSDTKVAGKDILGNTSSLGKEEINVKQLQEVAGKIDAAINGGNAQLTEKFKEKREEIEQALKELVSAQSLEEARKKIQEIQDLFASVRAKGDFSKIVKASDIKDDQLVNWIPDSNAIRQKIDEIKATLSEYEVDPKIIEGLKIDKLLEQGDFDKVANMIGKSLEKAQDVTDEKIKGIKDRILEMRNMADDKEKQVMSDSATKYNIDQGLSKWEGMLQEIQKENAALRQEVENLKAQLAERATAGIQSLGKNTSSAGALGLQSSTNAAKTYEAQLARVKSAEQALGKLQGVVQRWFSIYAVIRMARQAIQSVISTLSELDKTITNIAIVTDMSQSDLWNQMPKYTQMARDYAASLSGVYEVSQLYYQQGLGMTDVMALTEQTLKMARISGLNYADATNYMTNAVRSFKMEMADAQTVVDVYSAIAASSATSVSELANAMSKTASSAQAVGATIQSTTAMMAVMIEATRESPENIGSAMKSIISRYGEMKIDPSKLVDSEGEEMSLNKVDKALKAVGISLQDVNGEFRNFDDVIVELAGKWDTIDKNTQRYIATVMAGNRQQSRFLALVSSGERLQELMDTANNSEDASQLQFLKSLDSVDGKVQQLQTSIQALYTNAGLEEAYKNILDFSNRVLTTFDNISNSQGLIGLVSKIGSIFMTAATLIGTIFTTIKTKFTLAQEQMTASAELAAAKRILKQKEEAWEEAAAGQEAIQAYKEKEEAMTKVKEAESNKRLKMEMKASAGLKKSGAMIASTVGMVATTYAAQLDVNTDRSKKALMTGLGGALSGVGTGLMIGGIPGAIAGAATAIPSIIEALNMAVESVDERVERIKKEVTETSNKAIQSKDQYKTLNDYAEKLATLRAAQYDSAEAREEYLKVSNEMAEKYPELVGYIDEEGNKIVELTNYYKELSQEVANAYQQDSIRASQARIKAATDTATAISNAGINKPQATDNQWYDDVLNFIFGGYGRGNFASDIFIPMSPMQFLSPIDMSGRARKLVIDDLAEGSSLGTAFDMTAHSEIKTQDIGKALFGKDLHFTNESDVTAQLLKGLAAINVDMSDIVDNKYYKFAMSETGYDAVGDYIEALMDLGKTRKEINEALSAAFGTDISITKDIFDYRKAIRDSKQYIADMGPETVKSVNIDLFNRTKEIMGLETFSEGENRFLQSNFLQQWEDFDKSIYDTEDAAWAEFAEQAEGNIKEATQQYADAIKNITDNDLKNDFLNIMNNLGQISYNEIYGLYTDLAMSNNQTLSHFFYEQEQELSNKINDVINDFEANKVINNIDFDTPITDLLKGMGQDFIDPVISQYAKVFKNKGLSLDTKKSLSNQLDIIYSYIDQIQGDDQLKTQLTSKASILDPTSFDDLVNFISYINSLDTNINTKPLINALEQIILSLPIAIETAMESMVNDLGDSINDLEKDIQSASKGMDFKDAGSFITKYHLKFSDLVFREGKYYLDNLDLMYDFYNKQSETALKELHEANEQQKKLFGQKEYYEYEEFDLDTYNNLSGEAAMQYLQRWESQIKEAGYSINDVIARNQIYTKASTTKELFDVEKLFNIDENGQRSINEKYAKKWEKYLEERDYIYDPYLDYDLGKKGLHRGLDAYYEALSAHLEKYPLYGEFENVESFTNREQIDEMLTALTVKKTGESFNIDTLTQQEETFEAVKAKLKDNKDFQALDELNQTNLLNYVEQFMSRTGEDLQLGWNDWLIKYLTELEESTINAYNGYFKDLQIRSAISSGNISDALDMILDKIPTLSDFGFDENNNKESEQAEEKILKLIEKRDQLVSDIYAGNWEAVAKDSKLAQYLPELKKYRENAIKNISDSMTSILKGDTNLMSVTTENLGFMQKLYESGYFGEYKGDQLKVGDIKSLAQDILDGEKSLNDFYIKFYTNEEDRLKGIQEYHQLMMSQSNNTLGMMDKSGKLSFDELTSYFSDNKILQSFDFFAKAVDKEGNEYYTKDFSDEMLKKLQIYGLKYNELTGDFIIEDQVKYLESLYNSLNKLTDKNSTVEQRNDLRAKIDAAKKQVQKDQNESAKKLIQNYKSISVDDLKAFATAFGQEYDVIAQNFVSDNKDGTYRLNLKRIRELLQSDTISEQTRNTLNHLIENIADDYISGMNSAVSLVSKGTTNQKDINDFREKYYELTNIELPDNAFNYDPLINAWTLDPEIMYKYLEAQASELVNQGLLTIEEAQEYIQGIQKTLYQNIDILGYLKSEYRNGQARTTLIQQMKAAGLEYGTESQDKNYYREIIKKEFQQQGKPLSNAEIEKEAGRRVAEARKNNLQIQEESINTILDNLELGGEIAVDIAQQIAQLQGKELSAEDIRTIYRSRIDALSNVFEQLGDLKVNDVVDQNTLAILQEYTDFEVDPSGVITSVENLVDAYENIYRQMEQAAGRTTSELNSAYAKLLTAQEQGDIDAIAAMQDAMSMTYETLGEILAKQGMSLEKWINSPVNKNVFERIGAGKIRITDFTAFAAQMGWEPGSEEYTSAFKTYNDSLIELNKKTEESILSEVEQLSTAKGGDQLNFTELWVKLKNEIFKDSTEEWESTLDTFYSYGASFKDGIITLEKDARIPQIINEITRIANEKENLLADEVVKLGDVLIQFLQKINELIAKGIEGTMSNAESQELTDFASGYGLELDFTKTSDGLKLTQASAIALYQTMKQIDGLAAKATFSKLKDSLIATNENYFDASANMARIDELMRKIKESSEAIHGADEKVSDARLQEYQAELEVAREILEVRSTSEDSSFDFMNNKIPGAQNNPLKYAESWGKAWQTLTDSVDPQKNNGHYGMIKYQDFYNMVTEMGHLAEMSGTTIQLGAENFISNAQDAAKLIEKGAAALTAVDSGEMLVNLPNIGIDFADAAAGMSAGINAGIKDLANAQVSMLNGLIQVLELIVAMEKIGNIDVDDTLGFSIGDIFNGIKDATEPTFDYSSFRGFTKEYSDAAQQIIEMAETNEDLANALNNIKVNGHSMRELLSAAQGGLVEQQEAFKKLGLSTEQYYAVMNGFVEAAKNGDYDLDNISETAWEIIEQAFTEPMAINIGDKTIVISGGTHVTIDWESPNTKEALKLLGGETDQAKETLVTAMEDYLLGKGFEDSVTLQAVLLARGELIVDSKTGKILTASGKDASSKAGKREIAESMLKDFDADFKDYDATTNTATGKIYIGTKGIEITINDSGQTNFTYAFDDGYTATGNNLNELKDDIWKHQLDTMPADDRYDVNDETRKTLLYEKEMGIGHDIKLKVTEQNPQQLEKAVKQGKDEWNEQINEYLKLHQLTLEPDQAYDIELMGLSFNIHTDETGAIVEEDLDNIKAGLRQQLGTLGWDEVISEGVKAAFTGENNAGESISTAITTALTTSLQNESGQLEVKVPEVKVSAEKITIDLSKATPETSGTPDISASAPEVQITPKVSNTYADLSDNIDKTKKSYTDLGKKAEKTQNILGSKPSTNGLQNVANGIQAESNAAKEAANETENLNNSMMTLADGVEIDISGIQALADVLEQAASSAERLQNISWESLGSSITAFNTTATTQQQAQSGGGEEASPVTAMLNIMADNADAIEKLGAVMDAANEVESSDPSVDVKADVTRPLFNLGLVTSAAQRLEGIDPTINITTPTASDVTSTLNSILALVNDIAGTHSVVFEASKTGNWPSGGEGGATGTFGYAHAKSTLMGELGPELVVSGNRYFIAGQSGPEFVDLASDSIVFNHLQTEQLLKNGMSPTRGRAVTNERNAVAFAKGSINGGPAMASASAALAALKQLRAQWQAIAAMSVEDLASAGGGGGGGGGGGNNAAFIKDLEKWYDWLQQIAQLEKEITLEESKRSYYQSAMVAQGKEYYTSQQASLKALQEEVATQASLNKSREAYLQQRVKEVNAQSAFNSLYGFGPSGQIYYSEVFADNKSGLEWLSDLAGYDTTTGKPNYTPEEQYKRLVNAGFGFAMQYDTSGKEIDKSQEGWEESAVKAFWDRVDKERQEIQDLYDSVEDGKKTLVELQTKENEILKEIEDNQISVENKVLKAIEESRQREIDNSKAERSAIEKSAKALTDGLSQQLEKEKTLYQNQQNEDELAKLQRRLGILQRSGGSATEIASLQQQIQEKQYDKYFDQMQEQIDAIQDASDAELERLDNQIDLMEETLTYEKEHGLLWNQVAEILSGSPNEIATFIQENTKEYWGQSPTALAQKMREDLFEIERFKAMQGDLDGIVDIIEKIYETTDEGKAEAEARRKAEEEAQKSSSRQTTPYGRELHGGEITDGPNEDQKKRIKAAINAAKAQAEEKLKNNPPKPNEELKEWRFTTSSNGYVTSQGGTIWAKDINKARVEAEKEAKKMGRDLYEVRQTFDYGGIVDRDQLAFVHAKEAVFTPEQTKVLRNNILSNRPDSLISLLKSYNEAYSGLSNSTYDSISNNSNMVVIEQADVNMNVEQLANDYDARRAANTVMDEMLRIASKTKANNSIRR